MSNNLNESLLEVNALDYNMPASLTQCVSNNFTKEQFITGFPVSSGKVLKHLLNTGKSFVDGSKSYLAMRIKVTGGGYNAGVDYAKFGNAGSALNLIKQVVIRSKDGKELDRVQSANVLANMKLSYERTKEWQRTNGSLLGMEFDTTDGGTHTPAKSGEFLESGFLACIPMSSISSLFATGQLLPPQLCSGLEVEVTIEDKNVAFTQVSAYNLDNATFEVEDAYMRMATCEINDIMTSEVSKIASKEGLKILFDSYHLHTEPNVTSAVNVNVRANISQVTQVLVKSRESSNVTNKERDMNASGATNYLHYQLRHGSHHMPSSRVEDQAEQYLQSILAFDKTSGEAGVSYQDWFNEGKVLAYNFNRSSNLDLAGISISNSKSIMFTGQLKTEAGNPDPRQVDLYLKYSKLLTVYLSSVIVES
jgi:hypothetical protein